MTKTSTKSLITIITRKEILLINALNFINKKTNIDFGNFIISNWYL